MKWYEAVLVGGAIVGIYALLSARNPTWAYDVTDAAAWFGRVEGELTDHPDAAQATRDG